MEFTPTQSSALANSVYALTKQDDLDTAVKLLNTTFNGEFEFAGSNMLLGKTGGPGCIKVKTAFGFVLVGKKNFKGQVVVLFRGTQYLADWLSNANILYSRSCCGKKVHDGFNMAFKSMKEAIKCNLSEFGAGTVVHCVGHSLGGALASLAGEWLKHDMKFTTKVYTYGAPRIGFSDFASGYTSLIGKPNIYRVYHSSDIVPCIPVWPFVHAPYKDNAYQIKKPNIVPGAEWHSMDKYVQSVRKKSWPQVYSLRDAEKTEQSVKNWLKSNVKIPSPMETLSWINDAISYVLKKCVKAVSFSFEFAGSSMFTIMDKLAYILDKAIHIDKLVSEWVLYLMKKIAQFLGWAKTIKSSDLSRESIRRMFVLLSKKANDMAYQALSNTLADGRAL